MNDNDNNNNNNNTTQSSRVLKGKFAILKIYIENSELHDFYIDKIEQHNYAVKNSVYSDPGFQLFNPIYQPILQSSTTFINMGIRCSMKMDVGYSGDYSPTAFYLYPDSTIHNTPIRLSNNVNIIPSGYRDTICVTFDNIFQHKYELEPRTEIIQLCSSDLRPIVVDLVNNINDL